MSSWRYCDDCGSALDYPKNPLEDRECKECGAEMSQLVSTEEWITTIIERLEELEGAAS